MTRSKRLTGIFQLRRTAKNLRCPESAHSSPAEGKSECDVPVGTRRVTKVRALLFVLVGIAQMFAQGRYEVDHVRIENVDTETMCQCA
jgi:hypothetical protein